MSTGMVEHLIDWIESCMESETNEDGEIDTIDYDPLISTLKQITTHLENIQYYHLKYQRTVTALKTLIQSDPSSLSKPYESRKSIK